MKKSTIALIVSITVVLAITPEVMAANNKPKVIIIGAGMSGLSAGKTLSEAGMTNIIVLEATDRIEGRVKKTNFSGLLIELGANWVEGVGSKTMVNPIWPIANTLKLRKFYSDFRNTSANIYQQIGGLYDKTEAHKAFHTAETVEEHAANLTYFLQAHNLSDISILTAQRLANHVPLTPLEMAIDYAKYDIETAEPPRVTSLMGTLPMPTFKDFGENSFFVADPRGYETVVYEIGKSFLTTNRDGIVTDPRLKLNKVVRGISYSPSGVIVNTEDGSIYEADYAVVSVSIGVLQTNLIDFNPQLPLWKRHVLYKFNMAIYTKIFLKFPYTFWPIGNGTQFFVYAHEKRGYYPYWQHFEKEYPGENILMVTITDDESRRIEQQADNETKAEIMEVLQHMFGANVPVATDILVPKWSSDRFFKGCYSNWPVGISQKEFDQLREHVGRLYFTGEHTSQLYPGYLHGAYLSGIDSADMLIGCIKEGRC